MTRKARMLFNILIGIVITILVATVISAVINHYYFSWTDFVTLCSIKHAKSPKKTNESGLGVQKLDYFTNKKISHGYIESDEFFNPIRANPNYRVEYFRPTQIYNILRDFDGGKYLIRFSYVWRRIGPESNQTIYDGAGVSYYVTEKCGVPNRVINERLRRMIDELPVDNELAAEMREKLAVEFYSERRNLIDIGF